jgi:hypothetical protein
MFCELVLPLGTPLGKARNMSSSYCLPTDEFWFELKCTMFYRVAADGSRLFWEPCLFICSKGTRFGGLLILGYDSTS